MKLPEAMVDETIDPRRILNPAVTSVDLRACVMGRGARTVTSDEGKQSQETPHTIHRHELRSLGGARLQEDV